jgi:hypothetical protein
MRVSRSSPRGENEQNSGPLFFSMNKPRPAKVEVLDVEPGDLGAPPSGSEREYQDRAVADRDRRRLRGLEGQRRRKPFGGDGCASMIAAGVFARAPSARSRTTRWWVGDAIPACRLKESDRREPRGLGADAWPSRRWPRKVATSTGCAPNGSRFSASAPRTGSAPPERSHRLRGDASGDPEARFVDVYDDAGKYERVDGSVETYSPTMISNLRLPLRAMFAKLDIPE